MSLWAFLNNTYNRRVRIITTNSLSNGTLDIPSPVNNINMNMISVSLPKVQQAVINLMRR